MKILALIFLSIVGLLVLGFLIALGIVFIIIKKEQWANKIKK